MLKILKVLHDLLLCLLTWLVPRSHSVVFILSKNNFRDNMGALFDRLRAEDPTLRLTILSSERDVVERLCTAGYPALGARAPAALWRVARARCVIVDHNFTLFATGLFTWLSRVPMLQMWHGTGFKNIGMLATNPGQGVLARIADWDYGLLRRKYFAILSSSAADAERKRNSFRNENVVVTGYPRNDALFTRRDDQAILRTKIGLGDYDRVVLLAPTFRKVWTRDPFTAEGWRALDQGLRARNFVVAVKRHPSDGKLVVPPGLINVVDITASVERTQDALILADALVTDYSGIVTDFVITGRPVLFYMYDYEEYLREERDFYYDITKIFPGPIYRTENEFIGALERGDWFRQEPYAVKYQRFRSQFHQHLDGEASQRIYEGLLRPLLPATPRQSRQ